MDRPEYEVCYECKKIHFAFEYCARCNKVYCEAYCAKILRIEPNCGCLRSRGEKCKACENYIAECNYCTFDINELNIDNEDIVDFLEQDEEEFKILCEKVREFKHKKLLNKYNKPGNLTKPVKL